MSEAIELAKKYGAIEIDYTGGYESDWKFYHEDLEAFYAAAYQAGVLSKQWQTIETAPKGGGAILVTDQNWVEPPQVLLLFESGQRVVCSWDWYYAEGGNGYLGGVPAWVEPVTGEQIALHYNNPTHWMPLPKAPQAGKENKDA